jgi:hypothetical protein
MYYARKYPKEVTVKTVSNIQKNAATPLAYRSSRLSTFFIVISLCFLININNVYAVQVTLGWDQNNEPDIAGYKIYYGASSGNYTQSKDVQDKTATSCIITSLTAGQTYYFVATSYNNSLVESDYSAEISYNSNPAAITTTIPPTTTTSIPPKTTSTTTSVRGGGGNHPSTSTTTIKVTTSTTTSAPPAECSVDDDCDDKVFCNGTEKCNNGTCVNGQNPCGEEQVCKEGLHQCWDVVSITAASLLRKVVMLPILMDKKCLWLIVYPSQDHHFMPESSSIEITGPAAGAYGVMIDSRQSAVSVGRFIFVPVCIEQGATTGQWNITIKTDVTNASLEETIVTSFQVK